MKKIKCNSNVFVQNTEVSHSRNKLIKLTDIKNLYSNQLNKSINIARGGLVTLENSVKFKQMETQQNTLTHKTKSFANLKGNIKKQTKLVKNVDFKENFEIKNCFSNYLVNSKKIRNISSLSNNNHSKYYLNLACNLAHNTSSLNENTMNLSFNKPLNTIHNNPSIIAKNNHGLYKKRTNNSENSESN